MSSAWAAVAIVLRSNKEIRRMTLPSFNNKGSHAPRHDGRNAGLHRRAPPQPIVVTRGRTSIARIIPSGQRTDRDRQVSWLPGRHVRPAFPDTFPKEGHPVA